MIVYISTMSQTTFSPKVIAANDGTSFQSPSERGHIKLWAAETGGQFQLAEFLVEPGDGPPYHIHDLEDEVFYVLDGEIEFTIDGAKTIAGPGTTVFGARGVPHRFQGAGNKTSKVLIFITGSNFETFYGRWMELAESGNMTPESGAALAAEHGIRFI